MNDAQGGRSTQRTDAASASAAQAQANNGASAPAPAPMPGTIGSDFVGRNDRLAKLQASLTRTGQGAGGVSFIASTSSPSRMATPSGPYASSKVSRSLQRKPDHPSPKHLKLQLRS